MTTAASGPAPKCVPFGDAASADTTVEATLPEFEITLAEAEAPAGMVHFAITNEGAEAHEFAVIAGVAPDDIRLPMTAG